MKSVTIYEAKTHLSKLIRLALEGEEITICRGKEPVVRLVAIAEAKPKRVIGMFPSAVVSMAEDFDAPLDDFQDYMS